MPGKMPLEKRLVDRDRFQTDHLRFAFEANNAPPLSNLYVSMLQRLGINADRFGSSTGTLRGLEMAG